MVCLGNICRSPLAHGVLQKLANEAGLNWEIDSAGTGNWHIGEAPDIRSVRIAQKFGVDISQQKARQFHRNDFDYYDAIFVMDRNNLRDVMDMAKTEDQRAKVSLFLFDSEVPDPYYDNKLFEPIFRTIEARCIELIEELKT
ncbi:protein tyrosine phosphatase [bacterium A37T11]|nr:protein tyrosine phosphatase [bacterium A37T11]